MNMNNSYDELAQVFEHLLQDYVYPTVRADLMYHWASNDESLENKFREGKIVAYTHVGLSLLSVSDNLVPEQKEIVNQCIDDLIGDETMEKVLDVLQKLVNENILS